MISVLVALLVECVLVPKKIFRAGKMYLVRYHLSPRKWWAHLCLHRIYLADPDTSPHDHPSWFLTVVLRGGYDEFSYRDGPYGLGARTSDRLRFLSVRFRPARHIHRITAVRPNTWTLVLFGPRSRPWGFWTPGFMLEPEYLKMTKDGK